MLRRFFKNRRGTAEIIGSALFIVIILFFFSNVYLWHDQATRVMNNVLLERMNTSVSMVATDEGVNVSNTGGVTFALSRLWIIDGSQHYYADLENITGHRIGSVVAGQSVLIDLDPDSNATGSPILVTWNVTLNRPIVQYAPPEHDDNLTLRILTELGNTASCVVRGRALRPNINASAAGVPVGSLVTGPVGTTVTLNGSNFEPESLITVKYDGITVPTYQLHPQSAEAHTDGSGAFKDVLFNIPTSAFGDHILTVTDNGGSSASAPLDVNQSLTVAPTTGSNGTYVTLSGTGFAANSTITIDTEMSARVWPDPLTTTVTGSFTAWFIVPPYTFASVYTITATDGQSNSASGTFTVVG